MIESLNEFPDNVVAFACRGHVTREEYKTVLEPAVEAALKMNDKIRLYYEIGAEFGRIDPGAVWEDVKIGMEHLSRWEKIAVVTDVHWIQRTMGFFSFLIPGEMRFFPTSDAATARSWILSG